MVFKCKQNFYEIKMNFKILINIFFRYLLYNYYFNHIKFLKSGVFPNYIINVNIVLEYIIVIYSASTRSILNVIKFDYYILNY